MFFVFTRGGKNKAYHRNNDCFFHLEFINEFDYNILILFKFKYCYLVESFTKVMILLNEAQVNEINKTGLILPLKK